MDDADWTSEPELVARCCQTASVCIVGNHHTAKVFENFGATQVEVVRTGTYVHHVSGACPNETREPVVTWAHSRPQEFPQEAELVRQIMLRIAETRKFIFRIYGNDGPWLREYRASLESAGVQVQAFGLRRYRAFIKSLTSAAIGLQPVLASNPFSLGNHLAKC